MEKSEGGRQTDDRHKGPGPQSYGQPPVALLEGRGVLEAYERGHPREPLS